MKRSLPGVRRGAMAYTLVVVTMVCGSVSLEAQQVTSVGSVFQDIGADSAASALLPEANSVTPGGAFLRAVLVPGWGHVSIGAHTRARVYFALESAVAYGIIRTRRRISEATSRASFREILLREDLLIQGITDPTQIETALDSDATLADLRKLTEARGDQQEDLVAFGLFLLLLSGADAFVSAHLKDFPEPLAIEGGPTDDGRFEMGLRLRLPN
ncbi:MAG TPA: hypothetical protein EYO83_05680 [Gemmatimonadetes bacterium]|nr:hypothetical protein [Gemmatimonadota bacterium]